MTRTELAAFLRRHRLGVLSTVSSRGDPEAAVVGIAVTPALEIIFDTLDSTRKCQNLRKHSRAAFVIGWDEEITVQYEGIADEPIGPERNRLLETYFAVYPECRAHLSWVGITHFRVRPAWIRYSDFNPGGKIVELTSEQFI